MVYLLLATALDWSEKMPSYFFWENDRAIHEISRLEFLPGMIRFGTGELGPHLFPSEMWQSALQRLSCSAVRFICAVASHCLLHRNARHLYLAPCILITSETLQEL